MDDEQDRGQGDVERFPAEDLEQLYRLGARGDIKIRGDALNQVLQTRRFVATAWYVVTDKGVRKL